MVRTLACHGFFVIPSKIILINNIAIFLPAAFQSPQKNMVLDIIAKTKFASLLGELNKKSFVAHLLHIAPAAICKQFFAMHNLKNPPKTFGL